MIFVFISNEIYFFIRVCQDTISLTFATICIDRIQLPFISRVQPFRSLFAKETMMTDQTTVVIYFLFLVAYFQLWIISTNGCSKMKYINPPEIEQLDEDNVSLSKEVRSSIGKGIDSLIGRQLQNIDEIESQTKMQKAVEGLMGYAIANPCIVLRIIDANLTRMYTQISNLQII